MPRIIKHDSIIDDSWLPIDAALDAPLEHQIRTLEQWCNLPDKQGSAVQLEPGQEPSALLHALDQISLIVVNFPVFTDGRGFSYARTLREAGYKGELRAGGHFIRDQLTYLKRCGFDAFQFEDDSVLEHALASLSDFSEYYQAAVDQPLPLFRRRPETT
jgi:uncharacterized protein (DUF934 family)